MAISEQSMVGYLHDLSPIKASQYKSQHFSLNFQTNSQVYCAVCFSPEKHSVLKRKFESSSPVEINKLQQKKNLKTEKEELIVYKRTKLEDPHEREMDFDLQQVDEETTKAKDSSITERLQYSCNIAGHIVSKGTAETVNVCGKTLTSCLPITVVLFA